MKTSRPVPARGDIRTPLKPDPVSGRRPRLRLLRIATFVAAGLYLSNAAIQAMISYWQADEPFIAVYGFLMLGIITALSTFRLRPTDIALITAVVAIAWTFVSQSQPFSDYGGLYDRAAEFSATHSLEPLAATKSTTSTLLLGLWMDIAGSSVASARIAGALGLGISALFTALIGRHLAYPGFAWRFAALGVGLSPAFVIYSPVISSEAPLLATLTGAVYFFASAYTSQRPAVRAALAGLLFGLAYLSVPTAGMFGIGALLVMGGRWVFNRSQSSLHAVAALVIALAVPLTAQVALNWHVKGELSPSPSQWTALTILQGTSVACGGGWCPEDLEIVGYFDDEVPRSEADSRALALARDRWVHDPGGTLWFSVTAKQRVLWGGEHQLVHWTLYKSPVYEEWNDASVVDFLRRTVDAFYFAVMALLIPSAIVAWRSRFFGWPETAVAFGIAGAGLIHTLLTVQQRYHLIYMPFVFLMIGLAVHRLLTQVGGIDRFLGRGAPHGPVSA